MFLNVIDLSYGLTYQIVPLFPSVQIISLYFTHKKKNLFKIALKYLYLSSCNKRQLCSYRMKHFVSLSEQNELSEMVHHILCNNILLWCALPLQIFFKICLNNSVLRRTFLLFKFSFIYFNPLSFDTLQHALIIK